MNSNHFISDKPTMKTAFWRGFSSIDLFGDFEYRRSSPIQDRINMAKDANNVFQDLELARKKVMEHNGKDAK